ncbi:MAG: hypothetical protein NVSMB27_13280 [Ktedonobacteraceae bacterium]
MLVFKHRVIAFCLSFMLMLVLAPGGPVVALADSTTGTLTVTAGTLTEANATTPAPGATMNGADQVVTYTLAITLTDATGSGSGWNLTITSTTFSTGGGTPHTLSTSASSLTGVTATCVTGSTCTNATDAITYPVAVPAGGTAPTAVKFYNAALNTGMGKFTVTPTISISIPANTYAGAYSSTITLTVVSGP